PGDETISALDDGRAQASNLARAPRLLAAPPTLKPVGVFDAVRCVARDRLPCAGAIADPDAMRSIAARLRGAHPLDLPRLPGLFASYALGSRGLSLAALAAERIAAQVEGEPEPIERDLGDAIDPARELLHAARRNRLR
ncbi:MAG: bifunctional tRNA (5-methylaminomethyl-2-thiouridine)(34)-methyltransferase MnmD/FAD-dependent 5-carboxymethylaminomethyl-2-thiouridine(34) oxidoreductase MnmC, partial [Gemmatimonadota bacterium]